MSFGVGTPVVLGPRPKSLTASSFGGSAPEVPETISGLVAWYDFSDASTLFTDAGTTRVSASSDAIYQANDKSPSGYHLTQATAGQRPLYITEGQNGRSVGRFDGAGSGNGDNLKRTGITAPFGFTGTDDDWSYFAVVKRADTTTYDHVLGLESAGNGTPLLAFGGYENNATDLFIAKRDDASLLKVQTPAHGLTSTNWNILNVFIYDPDQVTVIYGNGTLIDAGSDFNVGASTYDMISLGDSRSGDVESNPFGGDIAEVILHNRQITEPERLEITDYLSDKWNITVA